MPLSLHKKVNLPATGTIHSTADQALLVFPSFLELEATPLIEAIRTGATPPMIDEIAAAEKPSTPHMIPPHNPAIPRTNDKTVPSFWIPPACLMISFS